MSKYTKTVLPDGMGRHNETAVNLSGNKGKEQMDDRQ